MMALLYILLLSLIQRIHSGSTYTGVNSRESLCGKFGFQCLGPAKLRLCSSSAPFGPTFLCPAETFCNVHSSDVCQSAFNYIDSRTDLGRCRRYDRIADVTVPNCKGYILCVPNKGQFQGVRFKCTGNTIFNSGSRTCTSPGKYTCPGNFTNEDPISRDDGDGHWAPQDFQGIRHVERPIDCKNYKFSVRNEDSPGEKAAFFCPSKPLPGESNARCTVFSSQFCITLQKEEEEDQFSTRRRPRLDRVSFSKDDF